MKTLRRSLLLTLCCFAGVAAHAAPGKPNIVFIYADDWGWGDLSCHGHAWLKTPNIDRLASEGTDFQQFNVLNPVCSPSRTAVMTGKYPARFSVHQHFASPTGNRNRNMPDWLDPQPTMLPRLFQQWRNRRIKEEPMNPVMRALIIILCVHVVLPADFKPDMDRYIAKKSLPQVEELMKNYEIDLIWFDTPSGMNLERVNWNQIPA